jgi:hypothetical protein
MGMNNPIMAPNKMPLQPLTEKEFDDLIEEIELLSPEEHRATMVQAGIIDEQGEYINHPYGAMGYGPSGRGDEPRVFSVMVSPRDVQAVRLRYEAERAKGALKIEHCNGLELWHTDNPTFIAELIAATAPKTTSARSDVVIEAMCSAMRLSGPPDRLDALKASAGVLLPRVA